MFDPANQIAEGGIVFIDYRRAGAIFFVCVSDNDIDAIAIEAAFAKVFVVDVTA